MRSVATVPIPPFLAIKIVIKQIKIFSDALRRGVEDLWVIGDNFTHNLTRILFPARNELYMTKAFETRITAETSNAPNAVGRTINSLITTINNNKNTIPKWIVIITEDNILSTINYTEFGVSGAYGTIIDYMMKEINTVVKQHQGTDLPFKVTRFNRPQYNLD